MAGHDACILCMKIDLDEVISIFAMQILDILSDPVQE